jgi:nicotinate-nucleotide--dimethylbenzimidazole phosphoribosyltransferase
MSSEEDRAVVKETVQRISPVDRSWIQSAEERQRRLTKPPGSLGRLEEVAGRLCAIQQTLLPRVSRRRIVVFAADHGVAAEGVSAYPAEVTGQMVGNFLAGGAAINALARVAGADLSVVDVGVASEVPGMSAPTAPGLRWVQSRVREGTRNIAREAAMLEAEMLEAMRLGIAEAEQAARDGVTLLGMGEMGIGNSTAASAITATLSGLAPEQVTGPGTGLDPGALRRKVQVVERALAVNGSLAEDPYEVLRKLGGLEIAALCGLSLGGAALRLGLVTDGFIATVAATLAARISPAVIEYLFAAHLSPEPGHRVLLDLVGQRPLLDLEMRLGEGTGAALAMTVIGAAAAAHCEMATFDSAGVSDRGD